MTEFVVKVVTGLISVGIGLLCTSLLPVRDILQMVRAGQLRWGWIGLGVLIVLFIVGYAAFGWLRFGAVLTEVDLIVALVLFFGACFVMGVVFLSRQTAKDVVRIAALERDAFLDPLTGLFNRRYLASRLNEELARAHRYELALSALLIDIDHFKRINDSYGHQTGDTVLRHIGTVITTESRPSDIVTRYGGEEILLIAPNTDFEAACSLAERLRQKIESSTMQTAEGVALAITASIGLTSLTALDTVETLIERTDQSLYKAKNAGRNCVWGSEAAVERGHADTVNRDPPTTDGGLRPKG